MPTIAAVVIGRNEGHRLLLCLQSLRNLDHVVYVDSGSTDTSVEIARSMGATVVELDMSTPFSAARGRNAGVATLDRIATRVDYVQFIDGDCQLVDSWMTAAVAFLDANPEYAVVCGRRRERFPNASIYNALCDREWDTPVGDARSCGGDALMRLLAFQQVGGFNGRVIAGEEPELCVRLRQSGWKIMRLDAEMTLHDAAMTRFGQWWQRSVRGGFAYAQGAAMHGAAPERHRVRETRGIWVWGTLFPLVVLLLAAVIGPHGLLLLLLYPLQWVRIFYRELCQQNCFRDAALWASNCVLCKFPQVVGQWNYWKLRWSATDPQPIEYKTSR